MREEQQEQQEEEEQDRRRKAHAGTTSQGLHGLTHRWQQRAGQAVGDEPEGAPLHSSATGPAAAAVRAGLGLLLPLLLHVMLQCAVQSQSDEEIARAQIGLQGPSPNGFRRRPLKPDLGARHDVVWDRSRAARHRAHPSGMRTVSSTAHAGRRRPAGASCRADMWREDAVLTNAGGANSSCGSAKGSSRTMPWRARPRPCYHEVAVAGRGAVAYISKRRRERCGRAPCGSGVRS